MEQNTSQQQQQQQQQQLLYSAQPPSLPDQVEQILLSINSSPHHHPHPHPHPHPPPLTADWPHLQPAAYQHQHQHQHQHQPNYPQHPNYQQMQALDDLMTEPHPPPLPPPQPDPHPPPAASSELHLHHYQFRCVPAQPPSSSVTHHSPHTHPLFPSHPTPHPTPTTTTATTEPFSPLHSTHHHPFALPQTIARAPKPETVLPPAAAASPPVDADTYVRACAHTAERVKVAYRDRLKAEQLAKEAAAKARGGPLTAKEKERERSRRESAVTRKRAEVYIRELEAVARRLPWLEARLAALEADLRCRADAHRREERSAHSQIGELAAVKAEPRVVEGTQGFMMNRMRELEIRLREGEGV